MRGTVREFPGDGKAPDLGRHGSAVNMRTKWSRRQEPGHVRRVPARAMMSRTQWERQFAHRGLSHASTFLHSFAPPALPGFVATMSALPPGRSALRVLIRDNELRPYLRPGLLVSCTESSRRSTSNHLLSPPGPGLVLSRSLPRGLATASLSRDQGVIWASPYLAGWPRQPAESSSLSCGPAVHLQLLSTPSHEDAVTFGYEVQTQLRQGLSPADSIHLQAH